MEAGQRSKDWGFFVLFWLETSHSFRKLHTHNPWIDYDRFLFQDAHRYVGVYTSNPDLASRRGPRN